MVTKKFGKPFSSDTCVFGSKGWKKKRDSLCWRRARTRPSRRMPSKPSRHSSWMRRCPCVHGDCLRVHGPRLLNEWPAADATKANKVAKKCTSENIHEDVWLREQLSRRPSRVQRTYHQYTPCVYLLVLSSITTDPPPSSSSSIIDLSQNNSKQSHFTYSLFIVNRKPLDRKNLVIENSRLIFDYQMSFTYNRTTSLFNFLSSRDLAFLMKYEERYTKLRTPWIQTKINMGDLFPYQVAHARGGNLPHKTDIMTLSSRRFVGGTHSEHDTSRFTQSPSTTCAFEILNSIFTEFEATESHNSTSTRGHQREQNAQRLWYYQHDIDC